MEPQQIMDAFVDALRETLSTMAMLELEVDAVEPTPDGAIQAEVAATIGLSGAGRGMLLVTVSPQLAPIIAASMLGMAPEEIGPDEAGDTISELANMIAGGAKRAFAGTEYAFNLSLPTRLVGEKPAIAPPHDVPGALMRGRVSGETLQLAVWLQRGEA